MLADIVKTPRYIYSRYTVLYMYCTVYRRVDDFKDYSFLPTLLLTGFSYDRENKDLVISTSLYTSRMPWSVPDHGILYVYKLVRINTLFFSRSYEYPVKNPVLDK